MRKTLKQSFVKTDYQCIKLAAVLKARNPVVMQSNASTKSNN